MRRQEYLQLRRERWFVRLRVPAHLVPILGQTHLVRSLDTTDEAVAQQRRWVALAELWRWIGTLTVSDGWLPAWAAQATDQDGPLYDPKIKLSKAPRSGSTKSGPKNDLSVSTVMERWLAEIEGHHTRQTSAQHRVAIQEFLAFCSEGAPVRTVDRRLAGEFVSTVLITSEVSQKTVNRKVSSLASMWQCSLSAVSWR